MYRYYRFHKYWYFCSVTLIDEIGLVTLLPLPKYFKNIPID